MKRLTTISLLVSLCLLFSFKAYGQIEAKSAGGSAAVTETSTTYTITKTNIVLAGAVTVTSISFTTVEAANMILGNASGDSTWSDPNGFGANGSETAGIYVWQYASAGGDTARIDSNAVASFGSVTSDAQITATSYIDIGTVTAGLADLAVGAADQVAFYIVDTGVNKNITTLAQSVDTSAFHLYTDAAGNPFLNMTTTIGDKAIAFAGDATPSITFMNSSGSDQGTIEMEANTFAIGSATEDVTIFVDQGVGSINFISNEDSNLGNLVNIKFPDSADEFVATASEQSMLYIGSRYNQTGTAGAVDLLVDRLENVVGSGTDLLMDLRLIGASRFSVSPDADVTLGVAGSSELTPTLSIIGDADSDAADTDETFAITITPAADPTNSKVTFTSSQGAGYDFDKLISVTGAHVANKGLAYFDGTDNGVITVNSIAAGIAGYYLNKAGTVLWGMGIPATADGDKLIFFEGPNSSINRWMSILSGGDLQLTKTTDTAIINTTSIGEIQFFGNDNTASADEIAGQIETIATSTWTDGAEDAKMVLNVSDDGTLNANQLVLNTDGSVDVANTLYTTGLNQPGVAVTNASTYSVLAANTGKRHIIGDFAQVCTMQLPTEAAGLNYEFWYYGVNAETHDHIILSTGNSNEFKGGVVFLDVANAISQSNSNGTSNSSLTINNMNGGSFIKMFCDGTNWFVTGTIVSDVAPTWADQ